MKIIKSKIEFNVPLRSEIDFPVNGIEFIDITPMLTDPKIYDTIISQFVNEIKGKDIDYIISPEARGFLFGTSVANALNIGFIPVRKKNKLPPTTIEKSFNYTKEYGIDTLCLPKLYNDTYKDKKVYIVDDIYATGNTIRAIKESLEELGASVIGVGAVLNILELNNDDVYSIMDINEEN